MQWGFIFPTYKLTFENNVLNKLTKNYQIVIIKA